MAKSVNKVILLGNLGKDPGSEVHPQRHDRCPLYPSLPPNGSRTRKATGRTAPSGTTWWLSSAPPRSPPNTSRRAARFTSKAACTAIPGTTRRPARRSIATEIIINDLVLLGGGPREGGRRRRRLQRRALRSRKVVRGGFDQRTPEPDVSQAHASSGGPEITDEDIPF